MADRPLAVVIGDMDLIRPLGLAGIPTIVAGPATPETGWSRYTEGHIPIPDPWEQPREAVDALITFARSQPRSPVLFYQSDASVLAISRYRQVIREHYHVVLPDEQLVEDLVDKECFQKLASDHGLGVPPAVTVRGGAAVDGLDDLQFPVVIKPAVRDRTGEKWSPLVGRAKSRRCETRAEAASFLGQVELRDAPMIMQECISGDEREIWSYHSYVDDTGTTVGEFTGRKIRTWPLEYGQSTSVEVVANDAVRVAGREALSALEFTGVAKIDFKRDETGRLHLLEINPRFSLWHHVGAVAGVNIPALVYGTLTSTPVDAPSVARSARWCHAWDDPRAARAAGVRLLAWLRFLVSCKARRAGHLGDPGSVVGAVFYVLWVRPRAHRRAAAAA